MKDAYSPPFDAEGRPVNAAGGTLNHSHSAAETLSLCQRKYFYSYILRLVTPSSKAAEFGVICHDLLERLCHAGDDWEGVWHEALLNIPNHARVLEATFPQLPWVRLEAYSPWPMPSHWNSETRVSEDAHGLPFKGFVDLWTYHLIPALNETEKSLVISDLKVSGNPARYGKDPDQLAVFGQPLKYGYGLATQLGVKPSVIYAEHIYAKRTGKAKCFVVNARTDGRLGIPWEVVEKHWQTTVKDDTQTMLELHAVTDADEVQASTKACWAFGGCEFADICAANNKNYMPFKKGPQSNTTRPKGLTQTKTTGDNVMSNALGALGALARKGKPSSDTPRSTARGTRKSIAQAEDRGITIPPAARAMMEKNAAPAPSTGSVKALSPLAQKVLDQATPLIGVPYEDIKALAKEVAQAEGKTRTRFFAKHADELLAELGDRVRHTGSAKGKDLLIIGLTQGGHPEPAQPAPEPVPAPEPEPAPAPEPDIPQVTQCEPQVPAGNSEVTFYFGCRPNHENPVHIDRALADLYAAAEAALKVTHWQSCKFGEGVKHVQAQLAETFASRPMDESMYIPEGHPLYTVMVELLWRWNYSRIVMG